VTLVVDSSVVVAALIDHGPVGEWAETLMVSGPLAAPHLMPAEVANVLRRSGMAGEVSADIASLAHEDLRLLRLELFPYPMCAARVWELRWNITAYDAWYVALAETLGAPLATLDARLGRAAGIRCEIVLPPAQPTDTPTFAEIAERIARRSAVEPTTPVGELIRAERDARST